MIGLYSIQIFTKKLSKNIILCLFRLLVLVLCFHSFLLHLPYNMLQFLLILLNIINNILSLLNSINNLQLIPNIIVLIIIHRQHIFLCLKSNDIILSKINPIKTWVSWPPFMLYIQILIKIKMPMYPFSIV